MARNKSLKTYSFAMVLSGISGPDDTVEDALFDAGCDDAILAFRNGVAYLEFDRRASSLESAILSAVKSVARAKHPIEVSHVEPDDLVNASEIARRLGCTREYVRLLIQGERGEGGFPSPLAGVTGTACLWSWATVLRWLRAHGRLEDESRLLEAETIRDVNSALRIRLQPSVMERRRTLLRKLQHSGK
jgi:hypothetical protein